MNSFVIHIIFVPFCVLYGSIDDYFSHICLTFKSIIKLTIIVLCIITSRVFSCAINVDSSIHMKTRLKTVFFLFASRIEEKICMQNNLYSDSKSICIIGIPLKSPNNSILFNNLSYLWITRTTNNKSNNNNNIIDLLSSMLSDAFA